ncbi:hypothetical protein PI95_005010 [Hassallia byssoidea VB512170]|uniref:Uncharacterized protein n=1 Tax=Hassallia byssoidea VB512170 TaxID=1304833 RepID=A0A846H3I6_9CYAN|nr:hypothetical protein [Hassalia byssoidea]NEU71952.1 hypothetical protein [Hassalia byssoidea VB512170]
MKRILRIFAIFVATIAIFVVANFAVGNMHVLPVQAQDVIENATQRQDSPSESDVLRTVPSGAVEKPTDNTQLSGEPPIQAQNADLACNNANFTSSIAGGFLSNNPYIRTDRTPNNNSAFTEDCLNSATNGECWGKPRYKYTIGWNNIKEWRGKACAKSVQNDFNNHVISYQSSSNSSCPIGGQNYCQIYEGPRVRFEVKKHNDPENKWQAIEKDGKLASYEIPANQTNSYTWAWKTSQPSDFRLAVRYAKPYDEFDFMMDK